MRPSIELLTPGEEAQYEAFIEATPGTQISHTLAYRAVLREVLDGKDAYLLAKSKGAIVGALPLFLRAGPYGTVLNSLPYFGSHGGVVIREGASDPESVFLTLFEGLRELAEALDVVTATVVTGPLNPDLAYYEGIVDHWFIDSRIGQVCTLPPVRADDAEEALVDMMDPSRWWDIRKARRLGVQVTRSDGSEDMSFLASVHESNMRRLRVAYKEAGFFGSVVSHLGWDRGCRLFIARLEDEPIAGLLALYHRDVVEYFVPAVQDEFRSTQAGSLVVFEAMKDAVAAGYRFWNLGGTATTGQEGVYRFKHRWGADDMPYRYYGIAFAPTDHLRTATPPEILSGYPHFYVLPFARLAAGRDASVMA